MKKSNFKNFFFDSSFIFKIVFQELENIYEMENRVGEWMMETYQGSSLNFVSYVKRI